MSEVKVQETHRQRQAVVYLRQSTPGQVRVHRESTDRQYALSGRAVALGWSQGQVRVIDDDLGRSGRLAQTRPGLLRLAESVAQGEVGAIFVLEVSRLARSSADWHRLLELCALADVLIADEEAVYSPQDYNDQLLLGLKGTLSEAERYWMRLRLQGGQIHKARRGELPLRPPPGYVWESGARRFALDPDERAQEGVRAVFAQFRRQGSAHGVARALARQGLRLPARDRREEEPRWVRPTVATVRKMLRNPVYTGTYVYGRREERIALVEGQVRPRHVTWLPPELWKVVRPQQHPAYLSWEEFMQNQQQLTTNRTGGPGPSAAREGVALLQGLLVCGRCGCPMAPRFPRPGSPRYVCRGPAAPVPPASPRCPSVAAGALDAAVTRLFLEAVQGEGIRHSLAIARQAEQQIREVDRQWNLRLDRLRYEARLAERRYKALDPDNRVVARTLEREWELALREVERVEGEYADHRRTTHRDLTETDRHHIQALAQDLPRVWSSPTTSAAQRKHLLRMLLEAVLVTRHDAPQPHAQLQVLWHSGAIDHLAVKLNPPGRPKKEAV